jgi:hypothetical protein
MVAEMNKHWDQMNESIQKIRKESLL